MILVIVICILAAGIIWEIHDAGSFTGEMLTITGAIFLALCAGVLVAIYASVPMYVATNEQRYEMLTYQYENNFYDNDNEVGKFQLIDEIREWNEDLAANKQAQHNLWVGVFVPNIYDQFEFIELGGE